MATTTRRIVWLFVGIILVGWATPLVKAYMNQPGNPAEVFQQGRIRVGIDPSRYPLAFFDADSNYVGLEIDLSLALGEQIGLPVDFVGLGIDGLYDALTTGQVDLVIAGLQPEFGRDNNRALYSRHYFNNGLVLLGATDLPISDMRDIAGFSVAYEFGSEADAEAHRWLRRILRFELRAYELPEYALDAARLGQADTVLVDALTARQYIRKWQDWDVAVAPLTDRWYTIVVRVDRPDILKVINDGLNALDETGRLDEIVDKWL